jgi:peptidoglycan hydrolase-like protein with peptidoglycan-binding domain
MKSVIIALLASTALTLPAFAQNTPQPAPQPQQQHSQMQPQNTKQPSTQQQKQSQAQPQRTPKQNQKQSQAQPSPQPNQQQAAAQKTIAPSSLSGTQIRRVQTALNNDGFKVGRTDGVWGPQTRAALENFQKSKGMTNNGQLNQNTMAALGVTVSAPQQNHG